MTVELIHHTVPGRARFRVAALVAQPAVRSRVTRTLLAMPGIRGAVASVVTGTALVHFEPELGVDAVARAIQRALDEPAVDATPPARATPLVIWLRAERRFGGEPETPEEAGERIRDRLAALLATLRAHRLERPAPGAAPVESPRWHALETSTVAELLAAVRDATPGRNAIAPPPQRSDLRILLDQLASTPVAMLGVSAALSAATGGIGDALAILAVLAINAGIGYVLETGAEKSIAALTRIPSADVRAYRDGVETTLAVADVAVGDLLLLRAGVFVAADARVVEAHDLTIDESSLTGESMPVVKTADTLPDEPVALADRVNMVYRGTLVTGGSGLALVVEIGARTEIGRVQQLASSVETRRTPMQQHLDRLGRQLALGAGAACAATAAVGLLRGQGLLPMFRTAVSLGVAAVPEGLPTVAVTTLALGLARMREQRVIVRQLASVETLGSVQVVCLDKTGTLTVNRMRVAAWQSGLELHEAPAAAGAAADADLAWLLRVAVLCNEVELREEGAVRVLDGSPTEAALVELALDAGVDIAAERAAYPLLSTQRRAQARSYMTTLHGRDDEKLLAVKGRPSEVLALCDSVLVGGERRPLGDAERAAIENHNERLAGRALRVLGFAFLDRAAPTDALPRELTWVGLVGMADPPREGVGEVIARFHRAGVRTIMITGDQSATAQAVGREIGIASGERLEIVDSTRLDRIEPGVLRSLAARADVFSRVSPAHKLQIVRALQDAGLVVAMTGDGVNDGPALRAADIGIAMGRGSASAARELADLILEDDQLATLIAAIEQGRTIYDDVRKAVHFILATNLSEIAYTLIGVAAGAESPLTPMQLLWINLLTDVFPELALAVEPPGSDVLARPPRDPARPMFTGRDLARIGAEGAVITAGALVAYLTTLLRGGVERAGTVGFTALTLAQLLHAWSARSETHTVFDREQLAHSKWLPLAVGGTMALQLLASVVPALRALLGTVPLRAADWLVALLCAGAPFVINEVVKLRLRERAAGEGV